MEGNRRSHLINISAGRCERVFLSFARQSRQLKYGVWQWPARQYAKRDSLSGMQFGDEMNQLNSVAQRGIPTEALEVMKRIDTRRKNFDRNIKISLAIMVLLLVLGLIVLGLDFKFMAKWLGFILTGLGFTLMVSVLAISLACVLSVIGALGRLSRNPIFNAMATLYVSLIRGTPLLVQVYMWYLALPQIGGALQELGALLLLLSQLGAGDLEGLP